MVALVFLAALLPRVLNLNIYLAHDETLFWEWSHKFFFSLLNGNFAGTIVGPGNPNIITVWLQVVVMWLQYGWAWLNGIQLVALDEWPAFQPHLVFSELTVRRLPVAVVNSLSVTGIWWLCYRLFGNRLALIGAILLILDPFWLADSRTGRGEGLLSGFVTLTFLLFILFWHSRQRGYLLLSGVMMGLSLLTKMSAISLLPMIGLTALAYTLAGQEQNVTLWQKTQKAVYVLIVWAVVTIITFWAIWPAMWVEPITAITFIWDFVSGAGLEGRTNYFFGRLYSDELLPFYYPVVFILRITPAALAGLVAFMWFLTRQVIRLNWQKFWRHLPKPDPLLLVALYPIIFGLFMTVGALKRDWYLMPAFPALDIVAAAGLLQLWQSIHNRFLPHLTESKALVVIAGGVLFLQAAVSLPTHPLYYTYWNPLVFGGQWASKAIMVGWDLDLGLGAHYLNKKQNATSLKVATRTRRGFQEIFKGQTLDLAIDSNWVQADYLLVRQTHLQLNKHDPWELNYLPHLKLEHIIRRQGTDYLWIYKAPAAEYFTGASQLTGKGILFGYDISTTMVKAGQTVDFKLYWLNQGAKDDDTFFVRLVDISGYIWAETEVQTPARYTNISTETDETMLDSFATLEIPVGTPPGEYFIQMGIYNHSKEEEVGLFSLDREGQNIEVKPPDGWQEIPPNISHIPKFFESSGVHIFLLGFDMLEDNISKQDKNQLVLYWQARKDITEDFVMGIQLLDNNGDEAAYWLGRPVNSGYPTNLWNKGEIIKDPWQINILPNVLTGSYTMRLTFYNSANSKTAGTVNMGAVTVVDRRRIFEPPPLQHTSGKQLGGLISLTGYNLFHEPLTGGGRLTLKLYWQAIQPIADDYTVFVQLLGPDDTVIGQHDGIPAEGTVPTGTWQVGEIISDRHQIDFPTTQSGNYRLIAGMYNRATGDRLSITNSNSIITGDFIELNSFTVE